MIGGHHAAGYAAADHHDVFLAGLAQVAVILLVGAVELQELVVILGKMISGRVVQCRGDGARERRDRGLNFFVVRQFDGRFSAHKLSYKLAGNFLLFKQSL